MYVAVATLQSSAITSGLEQIVYNIAESEQEGTWPECEGSIEQCLKDKDMALQIVGLRCLREVCRAHHQKLDEERKALHAIAERFLPQLEHLFGQVSADGGNPHQMDVMVLILKIFFFLNYSGISPCLIQPGRIRPWIEFMVQILDATQDSGNPLVKWTDNLSEIQKLDKEPWWQLKAICAKNSLRLYQKYLVDNVSKKDQEGKKRLKSRLHMTD